MEALEALRTASGFAALVEVLQREFGDDLDTYCATLAQEVPEAKAVKDAIWGMIGLESHEVVILDSPPFQRLRRVRQLGVGYLTYPTGGYSRFEHSLGAMHQSDRMLEAIALRSPLFREELASHRKTIRLAALVHDMGHLPLSHVSERYYTIAEGDGSAFIDVVEEFCGDVAEALHVSQPLLSEALTLGLLCTPSFQSLLTAAGYQDAEVAVAATAVVGHPATTRTAFVAQIISNVIDADKLDYMFRDGYVTGVPVAVDLERLLYKLRAVEASPDDFIRGSPDLAVDDVLLASMARDDEALVLGTDPTGHRLVYDLAVSRDMLFERVYLHHKTRAAERVAMSILRTLDLHPAELMSHDDSLFGRFGSARFPDVSDDVERLEQRRLPRRAAALSYGFLVEQAPEALKGRLRSGDQSAWDSFEDDLRQGSKREDLRATVEEHYGRIAAILGDEQPRPRIWVDSPPERPAPDDSQFMVILPDGTLAPARSFAAEAAAHPHNAPETHYLFASGTHRELELANIAMELGMYAKYGLAIGRATADYAKVDFEKVEAHKRALEEKDPTFFASAGVLRPHSQFLRVGKSPARMSSLAERFKTYSLASVGNERIHAFLDQFPESLVPSMLHVLEAVRYLDRETLGRAFVEYVLRDGECVLVPMTSRPEKSATHLAYYFADHTDPPPVLGLEEALDQDKPIVFYDDVLISGSQARSVLEAWFGEKPELDEELAIELAADRQDKMREATIRFRFVYAEQPELEAFAAQARTHRIADDVAAHQQHSDLGRLADALAESGPDLEEFLREVGTSLLISTKHIEDPGKWTEDRCREFAVGYGDSQRLVAMAHNCPTGTVTALWKAGVFRNTEWLPLFPRRNEEPLDELVQKGASELASLLTIAESRALPEGLLSQVVVAVDACNDRRINDARQALEAFGEAAFKQTENIGGEVVGELLVAAARAREAL